jgi:hypothetical protein
VYVSEYSYSGAVCSYADAAAWYNLSRYYGDNVWPERTEEGLQDFEVAFKEYV